jgi:hypothetical protein
MTQLPVMREEITLRLERIRGKFHGEMAPTTPRGTWVETILTLSSSWTSSSSRTVSAVPVS